MGSSGAIECQVVRILDADGTLLTTAIADPADPVDDVGTMALADVDDHSCLIDYYFGRGERLVVVEYDGIMVEGVLDTRWLSAGRGWWVGLRQSLASQMLARATGRAQVPSSDELLPRREAADDARVPAPLAR